MPIPDLPLFRHRDTVITSADQNQFVTQFENTMDTMSNNVIPSMNDAIVDINTKTVTATTARDESEDARDIAVAAKDEALTAVATLQEGAIDDTTIALNKAFSNQYTNDNFSRLTYTNGNFVKLHSNQLIDDVKTFTSSPIVPTPTTDFQVATKKYVDDLAVIKTIATGTATFTATTNNINLTGIGIGLEIGDVIQISGATDSKNNSEFTVEVITDSNNIIVNQAHANKGTTKNIANRASNTGVTVKLLAKWYNARDGLGQDWVIVTASRAQLTNYTNNTKRTILATVTQNTVTSALQLTVSGERFFYDSGSSGNSITTTMEINAGEIYSANIPLGNFTWRERR